MISKIFTAFFLPPGLFVAILAALAIFVKRGRLYLAAAALLLYALSIHPVADRLLDRYEAPYRHARLPAHADAVVTLGGGNMRGNPIPLMDEAFKRHIYGLAIGRRMGIPVIVSGTGDEGYDEFQALMDSLEALRPILGKEDFTVSRHYVEHFAIIPETRSADTYENALFSAKIIGKEDPAVVVVTSAYHMKRAVRLFRLAGIRKVYPAAVNFYVLERPYGWREYLPSIWALLNSYRALHEFFGLMKVELRELGRRS